MFRLPLPIPRGTYYARLGIGPEATADEIREAADEYAGRLRAEGASEDDLAEANKLKDLARRNERNRYDAEHPPLALLRLENTWSEFFDDRARSLAVLRRELERFLEGRGARVYFPSDLSRSDFTDDYAYSPILDGPR